MSVSILIMNSFHTIMIADGNDTFLGAGDGKLSGNSNQILNDMLITLDDTANSDITGVVCGVRVETVPSRRSLNPSSTTPLRSMCAEVS
jgi:hypothetical protein